jgi:hypothetical protein
MLGMDLVDNQIMLVFSSILLLLLGYGYYFIRQFQRKLTSGIDFFRGLLSADNITADEVPAIFKR